VLTESGPNVDKKNGCLLKSYEDDEAIVGYEADGTPITKETLIKEAREATGQVKSGNHQEVLLCWPKT
jgi:hypothetical protein